MAKVFWGLLRGSGLDGVWDSVWVWVWRKVCVPFEGLAKKGEGRNCLDDILFYFCLGRTVPESPPPHTHMINHIVYTMQGHKDTMSGQEQKQELRLEQALIRVESHYQLSLGNCVIPACLTQSFRRIPPCLPLPILQAYFSHSVITILARATPKTKRE